MMKTKWLFWAGLIAVIGVGVFWMKTSRLAPSGSEAAAGRKVLYYTCAMHPWVHENKPGPCPVCGMNLTPVYDTGTVPADGAGTDDVVALEPDSINVIHVQTDVVQREPIRHSLHLAGQITGNTARTAWFEATIYQSDLAWLQIGQTLDVSVAGFPGKIFSAQIKAQGSKPFADQNFNMMTSSTTLRAEISNPPVEVGDLGRHELFDGLHADAHLVAETDPTLAIPRSAVISRGFGATVYVDQGNGHYAPRSVQLGRTGDDLVEVLSGLKADEKVVTTGGVLIDSEAQLTAGE